MPPPGRASSSLSGPVEDPAGFLEHIYKQAVYSVRGDVLLSGKSSWDGTTWRYSSDGLSCEFEIPSDGRVVVVGAGKAAGSLAMGLEAVLGDRITDGCIVVKYDHAEPLKRIRQIEAAHPIPDENGVLATEEILETLKGLRPRDRVFVLLTGGASALLVDPVDGITLADKANVTNLLVRSGATISEINIVRTALSNVKGGGLLAHIAPAKCLTMLISDVPNGDYRTIGSGPTIPSAPGTENPLSILRRYGVADRLSDAILSRLSAIEAKRRPIQSTATGDVLLLAESATLVRNVHRLAAEANVDVRIVDATMQGNTHEAALAFAATAKTARAEAGQRPILLVSAGETTLEVKGHGKGGRNQEFALVAARALDGVGGVTLLAAGTDGTDGPTDAAGAFADGTTCARARAAGIDIAAVLADNDAYNLFRPLGDLLITGGSGTNVMDLVLALVMPPGRMSERRAGKAGRKAARWPPVREAIAEPPFHNMERRETRLDRARVAR